ncbi:hypothetical protein BO70DRAFT_403339 [Aspergillus heteromorphus CBS 117.55]|uniref:Uncharacterized protein n=1 Tax=Aspergillus heteromorphus CBS 117.55 TaxID=1448321 RepID=A0A317X300_9EURO|nr:uncharacterized protein BO70DRAFT_403339 [Aspergillus heteromorphus CBS 117.55]PWY92933.1 hypothetical protein BO70DRAFT_403339 [Aspergillus heteromorphus CBS 117.55]
MKFSLSLLTIALTATTALATAVSSPNNDNGSLGRPGTLTRKALGRVAAASSATTPSSTPDADAPSESDDGESTSKSAAEQAEQAAKESDPNDFVRFPLPF